MADDVVQLITQDHRALEALFERLRVDRTGRSDLLTAVAALLLAHSAAEEHEVYPAITREAPVLEGEVHHGLAEHRKAEELLRSLQATEPDSAGFDAVLSDLVAAVNDHVEEEENEILPTLEEAVSQQELEELGRQFQRRRQDELSSSGVTVDLTWTTDPTSRESTIGESTIGESTISESRAGDRAE